jgi:hypothetical protein
MPRKNYTPAERALQIIGALAGKSRQEINDAIGKGDALKMVPVDRRKELPQGSLDMLNRQYRNHLEEQGVVLTQEQWSALWDHCIAPKKLGDL